MQSIKQLKNLKGKTVLLRADFNVPIKNGKVVDDFRIRQTIPTIELLTKRGAAVIIISHIGDDAKESLAPVAKVLKKYLPVTFVREVIPYDILPEAGEVLLCENLRQNPGEKENDKAFAAQLAGLADIYVNDAFSVSHRAHASIVGIPKLLPAYAGLQLEAEIAHLSLISEKPKHPFLFILGGAKMSTKLPLLKKYLKTADGVFVGGALLNTLMKASGLEVGASLYDPEYKEYATLAKNKKFIEVTDLIVVRAGKKVAVAVDAVMKGDNIVDVGPETARILAVIISEMSLVVMNGPLGKYEDGYSASTKTVLTAMAKNTKAKTIVGGGDTVALVSVMKLSDKLSFVSTGGGATLEFLAKGTLVGIKALK
jgi:phosphoglycerate kinase